FKAAVESLDPPGTFEKATDITQLTEKLSLAMRQKLSCEVLNPQGTPVFEQPLEVTENKSGESLNWSKGLAPGEYRLRIRADSTYERRIELRRGDRMIVKIVEDPNSGIGFERSPYADEFPTSPQAREGGWRLAAITNQTIPEPGGARLRL